MNFHLKKLRLVLQTTIPFGIKVSNGKRQVRTFVPYPFSRDVLDVSCEYVFAIFSSLFYWRANKMELGRGYMYEQEIVESEIWNFYLL